jgi:hypothetical protein
MRPWTRQPLSLLIAALVVPALLTGCGEEGGSEPGGGASSASTNESGNATPDTGSPSSSSSPSSTSPSAPEPSSSAAALPTCGEVWRAGKTLPARYRGCDDAGSVVRERTMCSFGRDLFTYADRFYALAGKPVNQTMGPVADDPDYQAAKSACEA